MTITNKVSLKSVNGGNTPIDDVVDAPTIGTATAGLGTASVTFTAATTGGAATSYGAISTPDSITGTSATSPITVSGLTADTAYTFKTYGINAAGTWNNVLSAASNSATVLGTSFYSIATATGTGTDQSITFSSIPQTYKHLQIRGYAMAVGGGTAADYINVNVNGITTSIYTNHWVYVSNSTLTIQADSTNTKMYGNRARGGTQFSSNDVGVIIIDIHDYAVTNKNKTFYMHSGWAPNSAANMYTQLGTGMPLTTNAITSITLKNDNNNFATNTQFALYGIKGA